MATSDPFNYEYMNENEIDDELKCVICRQPLQSPVSLPTCNHTFCKKCIEKWLERAHTCPTCREVNSNRCQYHSAFYRPSQKVSYVEINTRIVLNQLNRLPVRCLLCNETNIQRCNYQNHEKTCSKKIVLCPADDIKCTWKGPRDELTIHLDTCPFQKLRPVIDELKDELKSTKTELKNSVALLESKVNFLLQLVNKGNLMSQECAMPMNECKYKVTNMPNFKIRFRCNICHKHTQYEQIAIHSCSGGCICCSCVNQQYFDDSDLFVEPSADEDEGAPEEGWD
jgi:hypothetical protein